MMLTLEQIERHKHILHVGPLHVMFSYAEPVAFTVDGTYRAVIRAGPNSHQTDRHLKPLAANFAAEYLHGDDFMASLLFHLHENIETLL